jgi:hypothetical protein
MKSKRSELSMAEIRKHLEAGMLLRHLSAISHYSEGELSLMAKCWGLSRGSGRRTKAGQ